MDDINWPRLTERHPALAQPTRPTAVARLERSKLWLLADGHLLVVANRDIISVDAMQRNERALFEADVVQAQAAVARVLGGAPTVLTLPDAPRAHRLLNAAAPARPLSGLSDNALLDLVGDLREALGHIRVPPGDPLLESYVDNQGRVTDWPPLKRSEQQMAVRRYLASRFTADVRYTERQVNDLLNVWHTFGDWALLRRELYDWGFLEREKDGSLYWVAEVSPEPNA